MPADDDTPRCDTGAIAFPTDAITLGRMRHAEPHLFTCQARRDGAISDCDALSTLAIEMRLAEKAFAVALGRPDPFPYPDDQRDLLIQDLDEAYREYGLSSGMQSTIELVRRFEAEAAGQAKGPRRSPGR
jgi:hypothetical protein